MEKIGIVVAFYALLSCLALMGFNLKGPWIFKLLWRGFAITGSVFSTIYILLFFGWI